MGHNVRNADRVTVNGPNNVVPWCSWDDGAARCIAFHISVRRDRAYYFCVGLAQEMGMPQSAVSLLDRWVFNGQGYFIKIDKGATGHGYEKSGGRVAASIVPEDASSGLSR